MNWKNIREIPVYTRNEPKPDIHIAQSSADQNIQKWQIYAICNEHSEYVPSSSPNYRNSHWKPKNSA